MERTIPFQMFEITRVERGAIAEVVVRPITVTAVESTTPDKIRFTDADGLIGYGYFRQFYETEAEAIADLENAA